MGPPTVKYAPTLRLNPLEAHRPPLFTTASPPSDAEGDRFRVYLAGRASGLSLRLEFAYQSYNNVISIVINVPGFINDETFF